MGISFGTIKSLLIFFGPILLPKVLAYYRSQRAAPQIHGLAIRLMPPKVSRSLTILFITSLFFLIKTFPIFITPSIFTLTQSRLQTPTDVLFTRLHALRPDGFLPSDEALRPKFINMESRLLYLKYGPETLTDCFFCKPEDQISYILYSITSIIIPHLLNLCVIGLTTSGLFTGEEGMIWRKQATMLAGAVAFFDAYFLVKYDHTANARATRLEEIDFFHWNMQLYRNLALAALNGVIGYLLFLSSTNRAFITPPTHAERLEAMNKNIDQTRLKMNGIGIIRNATLRDKNLRQRIADYWVREGDVMGEVMETREVVDGVKNALGSRINLDLIEKDAGDFAENLLFA